MTDLSRLVQLNSEMDYRRTQQSRTTNSAVTGIAVGYDGTTGQQKVQLANGGIIRATSISPSGYRVGDVIPSVALGSRSGFVDTK
jgi:hypothetical protein